MTRARPSVPGARIAVVARRRIDARKAVPVVRGRLLGTRPVAMTLAEYLSVLEGEQPLPLVLAASAGSAASRATGAGLEADRLFLQAACRRLLWTPPAPEVYDAISGVLTDLPPRRRDRRSRAAEKSGAGEPYLLLEGVVTSARASRTLSSPVRAWIVEHVARVRLSECAFARLAREGVRWSALRPVRFLGVVARDKAVRRWFPKSVEIWRPA